MLSSKWSHEMFEAVVQMVLDQRLLGLLYGLLHRLQLLSDIQAGTALHQHRYRAVQVPIRPL